jgi:hypothetical protein
VFFVVLSLPLTALPSPSPVSWVASGAAIAAYFSWSVADRLDQLLTLARLRILDALAGPEPEADADRQRYRDRERLRAAFPKINEERGGIVEGSDPPA